MKDTTKIEIFEIIKKQKPYLIERFEKEILQNANNLNLETKKKPATLTK